MEFVDLHSHSTASDGTFPPAEVVRLAKAAGLTGLALTDHDTVAGLAEASAAATELNLTFLPGIEISAVPPTPEGTLHILGYNINPQSEVLVRMTRDLIEARENRNPQIIRQLRHLGIDITWEEALAQAQGGVLGRPHIAAILVKKGVVKTIKDAFNQYLGQGGQAYFDKERLPARDALERIKNSGGIPVLAHPIQLRTTNDAQLERIVKDLVDMGLAGIEVIHSDHGQREVDHYTVLAQRYNLLKTGGSDFHGTNKRDITLGTANGRKIPRQWLDQLLEKASA